MHTLYVTDFGTGDPTWTSLNGTSYDLTGKGGTSLPSGYKKTQQGNPDLKWETTTQTNIGLDFGFFNQKLYGTAEYYIKKTKDILVQPPYLGIIGEGGYCWYNGASMENKGFEVSLGYRDQTPFGLSYDISGNISGYRNKVTELPADVENSYGGNGKGDNILGRPINSFYGYIADGLFRTEEDIAKHATQNGGEGLGRIRYRDLNEDGKIDEDDRTWIGSPHPDFMYGLNIELSYKNFDLSVDMMGVYGNEVYRNWDSSAYAQFNYRTGHLNRWHGEGTSNWDPILDPSRSVNLEASSYYVEDGSFFRIRNIELGYTFDPRLLNRIKLQSLRIYGNVQNPKTWSRNTGYTPEVGGSATAFGVDGGGYPMPVVYTLGFNLSF